MKKIFLLSILLNIVFIWWAVRHVIIMRRIAPKNPEKFYSYWQNRVDYFKLLPKDSNEIVFLGDSQIEYFKLTESFKNLRIKNRGIAGDGTEGILKRLNDITINKPAKIFIEVGINDLKAGMSTTTVKSNIEKIVNAIQTNSPLTKIYLNNIIPNYDLEDSVTRLNELIKDVKGVTIIDIHSRLSDGKVMIPAYNSGDNLHLSGRGYMRWKEVIAAYVLN